MRVHRLATASLADRPAKSWPFARSVGPARLSTLLVMTITTDRSTRAVLPATDDVAPPRTVLSAVWVAMLMCFAFVDIFGFYRADIARDVRAGELSQVGVTIDQGFLVFALSYVLPAIAMVPLSVMLPRSINRVVQIVVAVLYAVSIAVLMVGEPYAYYLIGSAVEIVCLIGITVVAWRWRPVARVSGDTVDDS